MDPTISRHLPLITSRIEFFSSKALGPPPVITPRIDFSSSLNNNNNPSAPSAPAGDMDSDDMMEPDPSLPNNKPGDHVRDLSELDDNDSLLDSLDTKKIPKPMGQPGRPRSGGYNIEKNLRGWSPDLIADVTKFIKRKAEDQLDTTQSYSKQKPADIMGVCLATKKYYPIIDKYHNYWPVRDMLKLYLKYTSENHRKDNTGGRKGKTRKTAQSQDD